MLCGEKVKIELFLWSEKAYNCYKQLKKQPSRRDRKILGTFERFLFKEKVLTEKNDLPFIISVDCLNDIIADKISFPEPIREAYIKLGCKEDEDFTIVGVDGGE